MSFKSKNDVCIIANSKMIVSSVPLERIKMAAENAKKSKNADGNAKKRHSKHKDPTDALGNFISELDVAAIERNIDFENVDSAIRFLLKRNGNSLEALINEKTIYGLCRIFDYNIRQLIELLMEKYPKNFSIGFVKSKIKPFIVNLQKEKTEYLANDTIPRREYKDIYSLL